MSLLLSRVVLVILSASILLSTNARQSQVLAYTRASDTTQTQPGLSSIDRTRLAEAFRLGDQIGDRVWPGWSWAPFTVLLVTNEYEYLFRHPAPSLDFKRLSYDALLKSDVYYRKRTMPTHYLATFPAIRGSTLSTIVVGQAENTYVKTSTPWVVTLLHEHFHQLQSSQPNYYTDVNALGLARGDQTGMWMLNYAFPYDRKDVQDQFVVLSNLLSDAILSPGRKRKAKVRAYLDARRKFQAMLESDDYKYLSFQLWNEGIARYTDYEVARIAASQFRPSKAFRALKDYRSFADVARTTYGGILRELLTQKLGESKREVVYSFGAAEGLLLDKARPGWRKRYFVEKFDLGKFW